MRSFRSLLSRRAIFAGAAVILFAMTLPGYPGAPAAAPAVPLEAKLVLNKDTYTIPADRIGEAFRKKIDDAKRSGQLPAAPDVDMALELTNTSNAPIVIMMESDSCRLNLALEGLGAVSADIMAPMTMEFRTGRQVMIDAGKSVSIPIKNLKHGVRGNSKAAFWTEPGEYKLTASYTFTLPAGEQQITVAAPAAKVKIEK